MNKTKLTGAMLATAVALIFAGSAVYAADSSDSAAAAQVKCVGGNSCKGQSACQSAQSSCQGQNACKGKGYVMMPTAKECIAAGGKPDTAKKTD
ncbi:MAG: BufA2 family periplasmic bufferin-type metallophore [Candidatus Binatus sp.]